MSNYLKYGLGVGVVLLLFFSCDHRQIDLGDGYKLTWLGGGRVSVTDTLRGGLPLIYGNVERYAASSPFIVGYASSSNISAATNVAGFFVLRTDNGEVLQALSGADWTNEQGRIRWANPPLQKVP